MADQTLQIAAYLAQSYANGPGLRSVIWLQGCPFRCPGCFNPEFWPFAGGDEYTVADLAARLLAEKDTEGVSFSGGEPFTQALPLAYLAEQLQQAGKGIVIFTGFTWAKLQYQAKQLQYQINPGTKRLLTFCDLLIAGPYQQQRHTKHPLLASANQELVHLSNRYRNHVFKPRCVEYHIAKTGIITATGFPARSNNLKGT